MAFVRGSHKGSGSGNLWGGLFPPHNGGDQNPHFPTKAQPQQPPHVDTPSPNSPLIPSPTHPSESSSGHGSNNNQNHGENGLPSSKSTSSTDSTPTDPPSEEDSFETNNSVSSSAIITVSSTSISGNAAPIALDGDNASNLPGSGTLSAAIASISANGTVAADTGDQHTVSVAGIGAIVSISLISVAAIAFFFTCRSLKRRRRRRDSLSGAILDEKERAFSPSSSIVSPTHNSMYRVSSLAPSTTELYPHPYQNGGYGAFAPYNTPLPPSSSGHHATEDDLLHPDTFKTITGHNPFDDDPFGRLDDFPVPPGTPPSFKQTPRSSIGAYEAHLVSNTSTH